LNVLLLAAGYGTRLKPITKKTPKCLVKIAGKALIDYWFELIFKNKNLKIFINTHYLREKVENHVAKSTYKDNVSLIFEPKLLGTAGTLISNIDKFKDDTLFLAHADNLTIFDLEDFIKAHKKRPNGCLMTMMLFKTDTPSSCGIVKLNKEKIVVDFFEKISEPPSNLANGAVYLISPEAIDIISNIDNCTDFSIDIIPIFKNKIYTYLNKDYHRDIGSIKSLQLANKEILEKFK